MTQSRGIVTNRRPWTAAQLATLRHEYPHRQCADVARMVGHTVSSTYQYARRLGVGKSPAFLASEASGRMKPGDTRGVSGRFRKGQETWNKGKHFMPGGRSVLTRFKPGNKPHTWRPIGSERVTDDGIRQRKVSDTGCTPRDWKAIHVSMWEAENGPVPRNHIVVFKDHNRENLVLENFELVTRQELMRRNSVHTRYPKEIALVVQLKGALQRQINKLEKAHSEQD